MLSKGALKALLSARERGGDYYLRWWGRTFHYPELVAAGMMHTEALKGPRLSDAGRAIRLAG